MSRNHYLKQPLEAFVAVDLLAVADADDVVTALQYDEEQTLQENQTSLSDLALKLQVTGVSRQEELAVNYQVE